MCVSAQATDVGAHVAKSMTLGIPSAWELTTAAGAHAGTAHALDYSATASGHIRYDTKQARPISTVQADTKLFMH